MMVLSPITDTHINLLLVQGVPFVVGERGEYSVVKMRGLDL
jgi:hypothetical protein